MVISKTCQPDRTCKLESNPKNKRTYTLANILAHCLLLPVDAISFLQLLAEAHVE